MSWEEIKAKEIKCLCGNGTIKQAIYGDDWSRMEEGEPQICCEFCASKYIIEKEYHSGQLVSDGGYTVYYLTPKNYPSYSGIKISDIYPEKFDINEVPFYEYLIKNYTLDDLIDAKKEMELKKAVSKLTGISKKICHDYKHKYSSVRITTILPLIEKAINSYNQYTDNKNNRLIVEQKEKQEREKYLKEKRTHQVKLDL